jgi:hypothetical protein
VGMKVIRRSIMKKANFDIGFALPSSAFLLLFTDLGQRTLTH